MKPMIGIVGKPSIDTDMWHYMEFIDDIRVSLIQSGALVVGILPTDRKLDFKLNEKIDTASLSFEEKQDLKRILLQLDGVVLGGGIVSNTYEEEIARICMEEDIPLIGICSGFNNMIRALGGKVYLDPTFYHNQVGNSLAHIVEAQKDSKLFSILKQTEFPVNSIHTFVAHPGDIKGYKVVAICPKDQTVEAIEMEHKRFILGFKWHPELMESMQKIFTCFVKECKKGTSAK